MSLYASYSSTRVSHGRPSFSCGSGCNAAADGMVRCRHCSKALPAEELEEHEQLLCPLKQLRCPHLKANGERCGFMCSGQEALINHCKTCKNYPAKRRSQSKRSTAPTADATVRAGALCEDCQKVFRDHTKLAMHAATCKSKHVPCPLHCGQWLPRGMVPDHILTTANAHVPLPRPSVTHYGGDNIHMVVAVLMEVVQKLTTELRVGTAATARNTCRRTPNTPPSARGGELVSPKPQRGLHLRPGSLKEELDACVVECGSDGSDSACSLSSVEDGTDAVGDGVDEKHAAPPPTPQPPRQVGKWKLNGGVPRSSRKSPSAEPSSANAATPAMIRRSEDMRTPPSPPPSVRLKPSRTRASVDATSSSVPRASSSSVAIQA